MTQRLQCGRHSSRLVAEHKRPAALFGSLHNRRVPHAAITVRLGQQQRPPRFLPRPRESRSSFNQPAVQRGTQRRPQCNRPQRISRTRAQKDGLHA